MSSNKPAAPLGLSAAPDQLALSVSEARERMRGNVLPIRELESVRLPQALGRVLAQDIVSPIDVPAHDNSAMDGWALRGSDLASDIATSLHEVGTALAGRPYRGPVHPGQCVRIMTGAVMPAGCDTVIPQELARPSDAGTVSVPPGAVRAGEHRRLRGEDLAAGKVALPRGRILRPADLGLLASLGIAELTVRRRLRAAVFSTGDELRAPGETLEPGSIYDSNRYTIQGMLRRLGCEVVELDNAGDEPAALEAAFRRACETADAVITSGGVSVGEADFTRQVMARLGDVAFWRIAMRPGRPMAFGTIASNGKQAALFGLPGNPVAVMVTFYFLVRGVLLHMMGAVEDGPPMLRIPAQGAIRKKPGRTEYQRGILSRDAMGNMQVRITGSQGSGILRSMSEANCMVVLHDEQGNVAAGEPVDVLMFDGLV
jgi:molybdopterin molybdotransferase